ILHWGPVVHAARNHFRGQHIMSVSRPVRFEQAPRYLSIQHSGRISERPSEHMHLTVFRNQVRVAQKGGVDPPHPNHSVSKLAPVGFVDVLVAFCREDRSKVADSVRIMPKGPDVNWMSPSSLMS